MKFPNIIHICISLSLNKTVNIYESVCFFAGGPNSHGPSSHSRHHNIDDDDDEDEDETPYLSASSWNMRIVPGAVIFHNIDEMTKVKKILIKYN